MKHFEIFTLGLLLSAVAASAAEFPKAKKFDASPNVALPQMMELVPKTREGRRGVAKRFAKYLRREDLNLNPPATPKMIIDLIERSAKSRSLREVTETALRESPRLTAGSPEIIDYLIGQYLALAAPLSTEGQVNAIRDALIGYLSAKDEYLIFPKIRERMPELLKEATEAEDTQMTRAVGKFLGRKN